ncbi:hypothetical protein AB840_12180 [Megasphaera cerevisiae DSM 20462]|uniref:Uncharacterized protein n=1 Tax=Megasphaera cerevisiae DSM 20462 TaxID=1122219 RepID=A0A0J6WV64_9FIRM|nr:hypothetical protein [Megasphaera cerevisiae]KMO85687.1 hypothetical protein AB840_12180 [Megasphaera cerevisiae DSM 20462]SKA11302.1 hypothetical protein SAMN05660900_02460 [Megasphaera cerevisiae DSM 20462]
MKQSCLTCQHHDTCLAYCRVNSCNEWQPILTEPEIPYGMIIVNESILKKVIEASNYCSKDPRFCLDGECVSCIINDLKRHDIADEGW